MVCQQCGQEASSEHAFCSACGAPLAGRPPPAYTGQPGQGATAPGADQPYPPYPGQPYQNPDASQPYQGPGAGQPYQSGPYPPYPGQPYEGLAPSGPPYPEGPYGQYPPYGGPPGAPGQYPPVPGRFRSVPAPAARNALRPALAAGEPDGRQSVEQHRDSPRDNLVHFPADNPRAGRVDRLRHGPLSG